MLLKGSGLEVGVGFLKGSVTNKSKDRSSPAVEGFLKVTRFLLSGLYESLRGDLDSDGLYIAG